MNKKQKKVLWVAIIIIIVMILYPPWIIENTSMKRLFSESILSPSVYTSTKYDFLFQSSSNSKRIDTDRLTLQIIIVVIFSLGIILTVKDSVEKR